MQTINCLHNISQSRTYTRIRDCPYSAARQSQPQPHSLLATRRLATAALSRGSLTQSWPLDRPAVRDTRQTGAAALDEIRNLSG